MTDAVLRQLAEAWRSSSWVEIAAAALAVLYVVLAIRQWRSCWIAAFASSCLYVLVLFGARLYMESLLNVFYAATAVYGWWQWGASQRHVPVRVHRRSAAFHAAGLALVFALAALNSVLLHRYTRAAAPFADSMVTWASVFTTFLVARKVYENWHWWFVIDAAAAYLYFTRGLYATMVLFGLYLPMIVVGARAWRRDLAAGPIAHA